MALLSSGERTFVMEMEDGERMIGKIEMGFKLITKACNLRLYLEGDTLHDIPTHNIFKEIGIESYYNGKQLKFMTLTKPELTKDFVFLTLITKETQYTLLGCYQQLGKNSKVSITRDKETGNTSEL